MSEMIKQYSLEYRFKKHRRKRIREYHKRMIEHKKVRPSIYSPSTH